MNCDKQQNKIIQNKKNKIKGEKVKQIRKTKI